jgi:hypothetical protein
MTLSLKEKGEKHSEHRLGEGEELFGYGFFSFFLIQGCINHEFHANLVFNFKRLVLLDLKLSSGFDLKLFYI